MCAARMSRKRFHADKLQFVKARNAAEVKSLSTLTQRIMLAGEVFAAVCLDVGVVFDAPYGRFGGHDKFILTASSISHSL